MARDGGRLGTKPTGWRSGNERAEPWALRAEGLAKRYRDGTTALAGLDLAIGIGEIYGLLGPNGAGKSTAVNIMTTLLAPTAGTVTAFGVDVLQDPATARRLMGVALQDVGVDPLLTGREALVLQARLYGIGRTTMAERVAELAADLDLTGFMERRIATYSGGMRRRLDLALALVHGPRLLVLDEPTTGLDPESRTTLWRLIRWVRDALGTTVLLTTQYLEEADKLSDRVGILRAGTLIAEGTPAALKERLERDLVELQAETPARAHELWVMLRGLAPQAELVGQSIRLTTPRGAATAARALEAAARAGIAVTGLRVEPPSLDEVFLELTAADGDTRAHPANAIHPTNATSTKEIKP